MNNRLSNLGPTTLVLYKREGRDAYLRIEDLTDNFRERILQFMSETDPGTHVGQIEQIAIPKSMLDDIRSFVGLSVEPQFEPTPPDARMVYMLNIEDKQSLAQFLQANGKNAADPDLTFQWADSAIVSQHVRSLTEGKPEISDVSKTPLKNDASNLGNASLILYKRENAAVYLRVERNIAALGQELGARIQRFMNQTDLNDLYDITDLFRVQKSTKERLLASLGWPTPDRYEVLPDTRMAFALDLGNPADVQSASNLFGDYAKDPDLTFQWRDAGILTRYLRSLTDEGPKTSGSPQIQQ